MNLFMNLLKRVKSQLFGRLRAISVHAAKRPSRNAFTSSPWLLVGTDPADSGRCRGCWFGAEPRMSWALAPGRNSELSVSKSRAQSANKFGQSAKVRLPDLIQFVHF